MKRYLLFLVLLSFTITVYCQQITFQKTYGGADADAGNSVHQTSDGGYIITGVTNSFGIGSYDVYLIKTDVNGDTSWTKTLGGTGWDFSYSVQQTTDSGYIVTGNAESFTSGTPDVYLIKTNANGNTLWTKIFGGILKDHGYSVMQTQDGGYIITGMTNSFGAGSFDIYLIKTDVNGDTLWTKTFGGSGIDYGNSVHQTTDGGYIIAGSTWSFGGGESDVCLIKTDTIGTVLWSKTFGGSGIDYGNSVHQTTDGGYIIAGVTYNFGSGDEDVYLIKTDANGDTLWTKTYGGTNGVGGNSIQQTSDGGYIISGNTYSFGTISANAYLIKTDDNGNLLWTKIFYGSDDERGTSVQQTADGGFVICGTTQSFGAGSNDVYLIKTDSLGNSGCNQGNPATIVITPATQVTSPATFVTSPATIVTTPITIVGSGGIVTTLCTTVGIQSEINNPKSEISVSPNPFTSGFAVQSSEKINQIIIYDLIGEKVYQQELPSNKTSAELNLSFLQQGVYFLNVKSNRESWTKKIVKM